jgi:hypothetical protein
MSDDPNGDAPLAWAKAGVINKGYNSEDGYFARCDGFLKRAAYIPGGAAKATALRRGVARRLGVSTPAQSKPPDSDRDDEDFTGAFTSPILFQAPPRR